MSARRVALYSLVAVEREGAWVKTQLKKELAKMQLERRDAALATKLCYGVLQNRILLDYYLDLFATSPIRKMESVVRNALRLALHQILYLEKVPESAAVN